MQEAVYYSQEDKRWANQLYSNHRDPDQTIATSGCGTTCFAMAVSSLTSRKVLPPETAKWSVDHGFRTADNGTSWGFFAAAAKEFGVLCRQTGSLQEAKDALAAGSLIVVSMGVGHFTGGGHYILLVGVKGTLIDALDPNPDNRRYGLDGLVVEGTKNDGRVSAKEDVFKKEARQYWIVSRITPAAPVAIKPTIPVITEEDEDNMAMKLTDDAWARIQKYLGDAVKAKWISDTTWSDKATKKELTAGELAYLHMVIEQRTKGVKI
jgi:hypothetical protein